MTAVGTTSWQAPRHPLGANPCPALSCPGSAGLSLDIQIQIDDPNFSSSGSGEEPIHLKGPRHSLAALLEPRSK